MRHHANGWPAAGVCACAGLGVLLFALAGCGGGDSTGGDASTGVPPALKKSNDQMEDFMKSQMAGKARKKR